MHLAITLSLIKFWDPWGDMFDLLLWFSSCAQVFILNAPKSYSDNLSPSEKREERWHAKEAWSTVRKRGKMTCQRSMTHGEEEE